jgi:hypothetical protein
MGKSEANVFNSSLRDFPAHGRRAHAKRNLFNGLENGYGRSWKVCRLRFMRLIREKIFCQLHSTADLRYLPPS